MKVPAILQTISKDLASQNARAFIVGGAVRDHFLSLPVKDYDIEVFGLESLEQLQTSLSKYGSVNLVGKSFGILKLIYKGKEYDFSFPRREAKIGKGHRGFDITVDGSMQFREAARRRDFTFNAMGYEIQNNTFLDPFGGREDIAQKRLRHIDSETFIEDPLRVYRAVQFAARFGYGLAPQTEKLCREMVNQDLLKELPRERVYGEWIKLLLKAPKPSLGFEQMRTLGILKYFPELEAIIGVPQNPQWHPEGDVWIHTMMSLDVMASELHGQYAEFSIQDKLTYLFAILCHDLGKAITTTIEADGRIRSIGHEYAGIKLSRNFLQRLTHEHTLIKHILPLVEHHLKPSQFYAQGVKTAAIKRLATKVTIEKLVLIAKADFLGRTTEEAKSGIYPAGEWLLQQAEKLNVKTTPLPPMIRGRDLIQYGFSPSPQFKTILDELYNRQLQEEWATKKEALAYLKCHYCP